MVYHPSFIVTCSIMVPEPWICPQRMTIASTGLIRLVGPIASGLAPSFNSRVKKARRDGYSSIGFDASSKFELNALAQPL